MHYYITTETQGHRETQLLELFLPPTAHRLPPTAYRLLPTAYRLPPTAHCQLNSLRHKLTRIPAITKDIADDRGVDRGMLGGG